MKVAIIGYGFVGRLLKMVQGNEETFLVDPKLKTKLNK